VGGAAIGTAVATRGCYDYYTVRVFDGRTANRVCSADVVARDREGDEFALTSCYYAALSDGVWTITARAPGFIADGTEVVVQHGDACVPQTGTIELTLNPQHPVAAPPEAPPIAPPPPAVPRPSAPPVEVRSPVRSQPDTAVSAANARDTAAH
jgi:hypothetical protein